MMLNCGGSENNLSDSSKLQSAMKEGRDASRNSNKALDLFSPKYQTHWKEKGKLSPFSSCLCICNISLSSSWDGRMGGSRGRQRKAAS